MTVDRQRRRRTEMAVVHILRAAALLFAVVSPVEMRGWRDTGNHVVSKEVSSLLTDVEKAAVASVDGDPDFIVGVRGLAQPLCFRLEGQPGDVVRLLQDPDSGVLVNARISRPVPGSSRTYLSAVLIARRNFRLVAKVGRVLVNRYRFAWGPVSVRRVHGHRLLIAPTLLALTLRNRNVTLVIKRHLPEGRRPSAANDTSDGNSTNAASAPNTASNIPNITPRPHNRTSVVVASRSGCRRGMCRRRRPDDIDHGPRQRNRRHRRPGRRQKKGQNDRSSSNVKQRSKRQTNIKVGKAKDLASRVPRNKQTNLKRYRKKSSKRNRQKAASASRRPLRSDSKRVPRGHSANLPSSDSRHARGDSRSSLSGHSRRSSRRDPTRSAGDSSGGSSGGGGDFGQADAAGGGASSRDDVAPGRRPLRELAAYVGFYVADARHLSSETHGLLGQFLHKAVTLQRVRQKANGIRKARLLVERPRPHHVKATQRTRTNMALNSTSTCWWLREGGLGVVDGVYDDYLVSRFRATDFLPLPPGLIGQ